MDHHDHIALIKPALASAGLAWADLGSGAGAFTLAARGVLGPEIELYSIDRDASNLTQQKQAFERQFPHTNIEYRVEDFTTELQLPLLDGIIMANSLHFVPRTQQLPLLKLLRTYLKPDGRLVLIEYASDKGNAWVPYPLSFKTFSDLAVNAGFTRPKQVNQVPSQFLEAIYCAVAISS